MKTMLICGIIVLVFNQVFLGLYCLIQEKIDLRHDQKKTSSTDSDLNYSGKDSFIKRIYHWLNGYLYGWMRYNVILTGKIPSFFVRNLFYRYVFRMKMKKDTVLGGNAQIRSPWNVHLGRCTITENCILDGRCGIFIGDDVVLGSGVHIWTMEHNINDPYFRTLPNNCQPVRIEDKAWVASDSTILPGVTVHEGAVVSARACVTRDCEAYCVYAGIPARKIKERSRDLRYKLTGKPTWKFF